MSLIVSKESIDKLEDLFTRIYTFRRSNNVFRFNKMLTTELPDENLLKVTVSVDIDSGEAPLIDYTKPDGTTAKAYDWDSFTIHSSTNQMVDFDIPISDSSVVDLDVGKKKVQINSARYFELNRFYAYGKSKIMGLDNAKYIFIDPKTNKIELKDSEYNILTAPLLPVCKAMGIAQECFPEQNSDSIKINDEEVTGCNSISEFVNILTNIKISDKLITKFAMISEGNVILPETVDSYVIKTFILISKNKDEKEKYNSRTPVDYIFMDAIGSLTYELSEKVYTFQQAISFNFKKNGELYPATIQNAINKFFHMQATEINDVQTIKDSNTLSIMSQGKTIYFYSRDYLPELEQMSEWEKEQLNFETFKYFNGVLDPSRTRDSKLINTSNELTVGTDIVGDDIYVTVKEIATNKDIKIKFSEFVMNKVLSEENFRNGKVIPNHNNQFTILQYQKYTTISEYPIDVKYARSSDSLISYSTGVMPFINRMVPTRVLMSSNFLDQSIPVIGAKPPIVHTDYNKKIYENNPNNIKVNYSGTVIEVTKNYIKIQDDNGEIHTEGSPEYSETSTHTSNFYRPTVKIGDKVKPGQIVSCSNSFVDGEYTTQVPLVVCFGSYMASEHEDGIVLTESAAKKFGHPSVYHVVYNFEKGYLYDFIQNDGTQSKLDSWSLIKKGEPVKNGDVLFRVKRIRAKAFRNNLNGTSGISDVVAFNNENMHEVFEIKVPYNIQEDGIVESVRVYFNDKNPYIWQYKNTTDVPSLNWEENPNIEQFVNYIKELQEMEDKEKSRIQGRKVEDTYDFSEELTTSFHVEVTIKYTNTMGKNRLSGKLSNYYGSKGVNTEIIPDDMAPIIEGLTDENGKPLRVECFMSSLSTYSRTNPGQIDEARLGLIGVQTWIRLVRNGNQKDPTTVNFLNNLYPNGWSWSQLQHDGKKYGYVRIEVNHFERYYTPKKIAELLEQLGLGDGNFKIRFPVFNNKLTEYKSTVGVASIMRLHFIQENKSSYTAENSVSLIDPSDNIGYSNLERNGGQKISAQEIWAASAHGIMDIIEENAVKNDNKRARFTSAALMLGLKLTSDE